MSNIEYQSHIFPNNILNYFARMRILLLLCYDINVFQEIYSVILRIYKYGEQ